jgi:regulator of sigma E protease
MAIVAAGPLFNLMLAAVLYAGMNIAGTEEPAAVLAQPAIGTPAAQAGLNRGDRLVAVDGVEVVSWHDARWRLLDQATQGGTAALRLQTQDGRTLSRALNLPVPAAGRDDMGRDPLASAGLTLVVPTPTVRGVLVGSAGERDGLQPGDRVLRVADIDQPDTGELIDMISQHGELPLTFTVLRNGAPVELTAVPRLERVDGQHIGRLGVQLSGELERVTVHYGWGEGIWRGTIRTGETAWFTLKMMGRMLTGDVSWRNISGPITIADYAGQTARIGVAAYIAYLALISISLGVLNLLPIPMLDGGHLLYYLIEIVRGKPLSQRWLAFGQRIGLTMLALLMGLAFFNDFARHLG